MKQSDDIANLFQQFGAQGTPYQELAKKQEHKLSSERWPLVSAVMDAAGGPVPSVVRGASAPTAVVAPQPRPSVDKSPGNNGALPMFAPTPSVALPPALAPAPAPAAPAAVTTAAWRDHAVQTQRVAPSAAEPSRTPHTPAASSVQPGRPDPKPSATSLSAPSPLSSLASLRPADGPPSSTSQTAPQDLPVDLPSVFARLEGGTGVARAPAPAWQPRKGLA